MAITNLDKKEITCKIIYTGAPLAGKTSNMRSILKETHPELKTQMKSLSSNLDSEHYFDFLPLSLGTIGGFQTKLHLYSLSNHWLGQSFYQVLMQGVDGFVFVVDSRIEQLAQNIESYSRLQGFIDQEETVRNSKVPVVVQYNKRDVEDPVPVHLLRQELNPQKYPDQEASATKSQGTMETLILISQEIQDSLQKQEQKL